MPKSTILEQAEAYKAKTDAALKTAFMLPQNAKDMIGEGAAIIVALAEALDDLKPYGDEV